MFDKEFYPTPSKVLDAMEINCNGLVCLEPSAGKGNIIDYLYQHGASKVKSCEKNIDLAKICQAKSLFIAYDFFQLKSTDILDVELIVMNPPFSNAEDHILHAWNIAPSGSTIIALLNSNTIEYARGSSARELKSLVRDFGDKTSLRNCFSDAERKTDVEVTCIKLFKPITNSDINFDGFFIEEDEEVGGEIGLMKFNEVRMVVQRYIATCKAFANVQEEIKKANEMASFFKMNIEVKYNDSKYDTTIAHFCTQLQIQSWNYIIQKMDIGKHLTSKGREKINSFFAKNSKYPFTMKNIFAMLDVVIQTKQQQFNESLVTIVDDLTRHTHENRYGIEGWKTNEGHLLNHKMIFNNFGGWSSNLEIQRENIDKVMDLTKIICQLTGKPFKDYCQTGKVKSGVWYETYLFEYKLYKKGSMHMKFKNLSDWEALNKAYGKIKGMVLPEKLKV